MKLQISNRDHSSFSKLIFLLPIVALPFITLLLWSVGIVGNVYEKPVTTHANLNTNLPGAIIQKDSSWDKLKFYEKADSDSEKYRANSF